MIILFVDIHVLMDGILLVIQDTLTDGSKLVVQRVLPTELYLSLQTEVQEEYPLQTKISGGKVITIRFNFKTG